MPNTAAALFITDGEKMKIVLRKKATIYEFAHELTHANHAKNIGLRRYLALGGRGTSGELAKEMLVFRNMVKHKDFFTRVELSHAINYIQRVRRRYGEPFLELDFNIKTIPSVRPIVEIHKIVKL